MLRINLTLISLFLAIQLVGQEYDVDTIINNGPDENRIVLAVLGDGYMEWELDFFILDVNKIINELLETPPFKEYKDYFNVYAIKTISNESGADHPGTATDVTEPASEILDVDNRFGSTFDFSNIHRLLVPRKSGDILNVLAQNLPNYDQVIIIVNSKEYGGSGGQFAVSSTNSNAGEIAIHEIGHSFSGLADEYWAGFVFAREARNMTKETNPEIVKWNNWIQEFGVGIYPHGSSGGMEEWHRPHQSCKMRSLGRPFCRVCAESFIDQFYSLITPIEAISPIDDILTINEPFPFTIELVNEDLPNLQQIWLIDEDTLLTNSSSILFDPVQLENEEGQLSFHLYDDSELSRSYLPNSGYFWSVNWDISKGQTTSTIAQNAPLAFKYKIYPNPSAEKIMLEYSNPNRDIKDLNVAWYSTNGSMMFSRKYSIPSEQGTLELLKPRTESQIELLRLSDPISGWHKTIILNK